MQQAQPPAAGKYSSPGSAPVEGHDSLAKLLVNNAQRCPGGRCPRNCAIRRLLPDPLAPVTTVVGILSAAVSMLALKTIATRRDDLPAVNARTS